MNNRSSASCGELIDTYVYRFPGHGGKEVVGLSYAGVREAIRRRGGVQILEYHVEEGPDEFRALVKVRDHVNLVEMVGASTCKKTQPFAYTLAYNKAERNAFRKLLPEKWMAMVLREFRQRKPQRTLTGEPKLA